MSKSVAVAILCAAVGAPAYAADDPWEPLRFLVGTWEAKTQGGSAGASSSGTYTFQFELKNHVLARHSAGADCRGPADFNCEHSDLLYVYERSARGPLQAIYFDNEGHTIQYDVTTPGPNTVVFVSAPSQPGPQFRLTYERKGDVLDGKFQVRMPGGSPEFKSYLEWSGRKK